MAGTTVTFPNTSTLSGVSVANAKSAVISLTAGDSRRYVYLPTATSNGRGASFWVSHNGSVTESFLTPMIVKWEDRAAVQGYCNPQWAISVSGPIDYVIDCSNDTGATYTEFA